MIYHYHVRQGLALSRTLLFAFDDFTLTVGDHDDQTCVLLIRPPPEMGVRWTKQAHHTSQMDRLRMRGEELAVEAPARPSGRDGVMASPPPLRRRWLMEGAGAAFQHALTASTVTYDQSEHRPRRLRACTDSQAIGGGPRGCTRLRCKVIAYMTNCVTIPTFIQYQ